MTLRKKPKRAARGAPASDVAWALHALVTGGFGRPVTLADGTFGVELISMDDIKAARDTRATCPAARPSSTKR
jgi:hypothetical protein